MGHIRCIDSGACPCRVQDTLWHVGCMVSIPGTPTLQVPTGTPMLQTSGTPVQTQGGSSPTAGSSTLAKPFVPAKFDLLTLEDDGKNYKTWYTALTLAFTNHGIWSIVNGTEPCLTMMSDPTGHEEWCLKDRKAQLMILLALKKVGQKCIFCAKTSKEYWDRISCYDLTNFSHLPYPSLDTPQVITYDLKTTTKPPVIFPSASPPELMGKAPLPLNPPSLPPVEQPISVTPQWTKPSQVIMTRSPSPAMSIYPDFDLPTMQPPTPIPWSTYHQQYSSMESYQEPPLVENPLEDQDSPIEDVPPPKLEPTQYLNTEDGTVHLANKEPPLRVWTEYHNSPPSPISCKHSLSPTSLSSAPIRQRTSREGSYQSITPSASSPIAGTSPQSQGYQSTSPEGSADNPSSMQSSTDDADSDMALNWVTINMDYLKG